MAWPLRRVLAKGVLINTTWNPPGSFRLFSWCLWPFQDCRYQTKPLSEAKELEGSLKSRLRDSVWSKKGGKKAKEGKQKKRHSCVLLSASNWCVICECLVTQWAWIHYLCLSVLSRCCVKWHQQSWKAVCRPGHRQYVASCRFKEFENSALSRLQNQEPG